MSKAQQAPPPASPSPSPTASDGRLKIPLRASAPKMLVIKADLERVEGRELSWDETMTLILGHVELRSPDAVMLQTASQLRALERYLEDHREDVAGGIVEIFREALLDVLRGKIEARRLSEAILNVG